MAGGRRRGGAGPVPGGGHGPGPGPAGPILRDRFGRHCRVEAEAACGTPARLVVAAHTASGLAEQLAGFGTTIEVLEPGPVRTELARIGAALAARYGA